MKKLLEYLLLIFGCALFFFFNGNKEEQTSTGTGARLSSRTVEITEIVTQK